MTDLSTEAAVTVGGKPSCPPQARKYVLSAAILATSMGFIDGSVVSLATPAIRADLGASLADAQWISNAYMLFLSALVLTGGAAGDVFGVRNIFGIGVTLFMVTSVLCALAPDENTLIIMRGAQGIGAALMVPGSLSLIAKSYPSEIRGRAIGTWAAFSSITTAFGPMLGSLVLSFGEPWMWRLIFAINAPVGLIVLAMLFAKVPADPPGDGRRLDHIGALLATAGLGSIAWGLTSLGVDAEAKFVPAWAWLAAGVVLAAAFLSWERRASAPMVRLDLFQSAAFSGANLYTLILFFAFHAILFYLPMTLIGGWGVIEWQASLMFLPMSIFIGGFSRQAGALADRIGPKWPLVAGASCVSLSYVLLAATMPLMNLWEVVFPIMLLNGAGMAMLVSPLSTAVMQAAPDRDAGLASGINNAIARSAGLMSVAAFGALAALAYGSRSTAAGSEAGFGEKLSAGVSASAAQMHAAASNSAFQAIAIGCAIACAVAAVIAFFTQPSNKGSRRSA